jgi:hypothetical protein
MQKIPQLHVYKKLDLHVLVLMKKAIKRRKRSAIKANPISG